MADVFISYSSHDHDKAAKLTERLRAAGLSVWIDEANISAATQWSSEIVRAIEECKVFIILLSVHSFGSHNVIKELSLASEEKKHIIPVELETLELTHEVKYQLAGIQRVSIKNYDAIEHAVKSFIGDGTASAEQTQVPAPKKKGSAWKKYGISIFAALAFLVYLYFQVFTKEQASDAQPKTYEIKKVLVLPFESLSSNKDDEYFADGLTTEVINTLSGLSGMQITDRKTAMQYKGRKTDLKAIAKELDIQYVVDGTVQKQDQNVKITMQLIEAVTGKTILSESYDGSLNDLFALQTRIAKSVAFELQRNLVRQNIDTNIVRKGTQNPEAYNKFVTAIGMLDDIYTEAALMKGLGYLEEANKLDPNFAYPYYYRGLGYLARSKAFSHSKRDMEIADSFAHVALRVDPKYPEPHILLAQLAGFRGQLDTAVAEVQKYMKQRPDDIQGYGFLGLLFYNSGQFDRAANYLEKSVQKNITGLSNWSILIDCFQAMGDTVKRNKYIDESQPLYELFLSKNPDAVGIRIHYALNLANRGKRDEAHRQIELIKMAKDVPGIDLYNVACAYSQLNEPKEAIATLKKAFDSGFNPRESINTDPDFKNLREMSEFKALAKQMVEADRTR